MPTSNTPKKMTAAARRALDLTGRLIDTFGPRPAGSDKSRSTADALRNEAAEFADKAWTEDFSVHPGAFLGYIRVMVVLTIVAVACLWLEVYFLAALLATAGMVIMLGEFFFFREVLDPLFPRREGRNVLATVEPEKEVRGQLIISGHHDSAQVLNFLVHQPSLYLVRVMGGIGNFILLFLATWVLTIWQVVTGFAPGWSPIVAGFFTVMLLLAIQLWWFASSRYTPGAGDNLASSAAAWEALRELAGQKAAGTGLKHLRVIAASWDAEESGLRGARSWVKNRGDGRLDPPTWNLNLECLYNVGDLFFLTSDVNGFVRLSAEMAERCQRLLAAYGYEAPPKPFPILTGGTDAAELAKGGAKATTLIGMPWGHAARSTPYHTPGDTLEVVDRNAVAAAIGLALDLAEDLDGELSWAR